MGSDAKDYDFWLQREKLLKGLDLAAQNQAEAVRLHEELERLYEQTAVIKVTARLLRNKLTTTLNKHNFL